jgi:hypothetical protein
MSASSNAKLISTSEYESVVAAVNVYLDALRAGSTDLLTRAFREDASMHGLDANGKVAGGSFKALFEFIKQFGASPNLRAHVDVLSITPSTAVAKIDMEQATGPTPNYTDYHSLIKEDGKWRIAAKLFHAYA